MGKRDLVQRIVRWVVVGVVDFPPQFDVLARTSVVARGVTVHPIPQHQILLHDRLQHAVGIPRNLHLFLGGLLRRVGRVENARVVLSLCRIVEGRGRESLARSEEGDVGNGYGGGRTLACNKVKRFPWWWVHESCRNHEGGREGGAGEVGGEGGRRKGEGRWGRAGGRRWERGVFA